MPATVTVIDEALEPFDHASVPGAFVESVELPQLFTTATDGVAGVAFGAAVPLPGALVQPFTVEVTV